MWSQEWMITMKNSASEDWKINESWIRKITSDTLQIMNKDYNVCKFCRHFLISFVQKMRKTKIIILSLLMLLLWVNICLAWVVDPHNIWLASKITDQSIAIWASWWDTLQKATEWWLNILHSIKIILSWIIIIYLIYLGFQMVMALWADDKMKSSKVQIYYTILAFLFINIPGQIYWVFTWKTNNHITDRWWVGFADVNRDWTGNIFVNFLNWNYTVETGVLSFIKVMIVGIVILMFVLGWLWLITSGWNDEKRKKARARFVNWILWLVFIGIIQTWVQVVYNWDIWWWQNLFAQLSNLAIFFAWPVAIFFLIMWWFYYITSSGDEAKAKKWTMIIKNTFVAVIILLACYSFLKDISTFKIN